MGGDLLGHPSFMHRDHQMGAGLSHMQVAEAQLARLLGVPIKGSNTRLATLMPGNYARK